MTTDKRAPYNFNRVIKLEPRQNGHNYGGEKELISTHQFVATLPKGHYSGRKIDAVITIRCYMGRSRNASTVYASLWARSRDGEIHLAGHGSASGYGYHKESAAVNDAFRSAGVTMAAAFDGCGDSTMRIAIEALARKLGWRNGNML
jgi:hypothetical protein